MTRTDEDRPEGVKVSIKTRVVTVEGKEKYLAFFFELIAEFTPGPKGMKYGAVFHITSRLTLSRQVNQKPRPFEREL